MKKILSLLIMMMIYVASYSQKSKSLEQIVEENKGKVIFVDYWASWCKPCRKEMRNIPEIEERYENKEIVFVYLSVDLDEEEWKKASAKLGILNEKYNLMTVKMIKGTKYFTSIPHYLIFNKNSQLVNNNAPRPSDKKLYDELDKYLNE
jgi:thiol-disulfide isomerase/thioredoxin